jgi:hypothetical protein
VDSRMLCVRAYRATTIVLSMLMLDLLPHCVLDLTDCGRLWLPGVHVGLYGVSVLWLLLMPSCVCPKAY